ncbi:hypothetical protein Tco_1317322 [Tanacetum coccineum]
MEWLPMCAKLEEAVGVRNWLDIVFLYCQKFLAEHRDFSIKVNRLVGQMNEACQDRIAFVQELESVAGVAVIAKTVVFLTEMMDKEGFRELQLRDLEKEARERALEIKMFVQKLMCKMVEFMKQLQVVVGLVGGVVVFREEEDAVFYCGFDVENLIQSEISGVFKRIEMKLEDARGYLLEVFDLYFSSGALSSVGISKRVKTAD